MLVGLGINTTVTTTGAAAAEFRTDANHRAYILEVGATTGAATACTHGIGKPAAIGVTPTTPIDVLPCDPADVVIANSFQSAVAWATPPTAPAQFLRRNNIPATIGAGWILAFPRGSFVVGVSSSFVVWNLATNSNNVNIYILAEI